MRVPLVQLGAGLPLVPLVLRDELHCGDAFIPPAERDHQPRKVAAHRSTLRSTGLADLATLTVTASAHCRVQHEGAARRHAMSPPPEGLEVNGCSLVSSRVLGHGGEEVGVLLRGLLTLVLTS